MMLGSIPQQDVFQRVMSSKNESVARLGPIIGGSLYIVFAFIPMFVVTAAVLVMPEATAALMEEDPQKILPTLVMQHMPVALQIAFFGALLSAMMPPHRPPCWRPRPRLWRTCCATSSPA